MKLGPRWQDPAGRAAAAATWRERRSLRLDDFLDDDVALALRDAVRELPHSMIAEHAPGFGFQYAAFTSPAEDDCDHVWCRFTRWWWSDGLAFVTELTAMELKPPADRRMVSTLFERGSFLGPHNDHDGVRRCAYVLGLTRDTWPAEHGGHLEFLAAEDHDLDDDVIVVERRVPGWNTLDLFDVTGTRCFHQVPIVIRDVERRALSGWFH